MEYLNIDKIKNVLIKKEKKYKELAAEIDSAVFAIAVNLLEELKILPAWRIRDGKIISKT